MDRIRRVLFLLPSIGWILASAQTSTSGPGRSGPAAKKTATPSANISYGALRRGTIARRGGRQAFTFTASTGDVLIVQAQRCNIQGGSPVSMKPIIEIREPGGDVLVDAVEDDRHNHVAVRGFLVKSGRLLSLVVGDFGDREQYYGGPLPSFCSA